MRFELIATLSVSTTPIGQLIAFWQLTSEEVALLKAGRRQVETERRQIRELVL